jgi:hypothetical protein
VRLAPLIFGVLTLGVAVRTAHYFANRSLWLDEAMLGLNIGERSFAALLQPLAFNQAAPLGFLWLEKLAVTALGVSEMALRLFPLLAGILGLFVFAVLARRLLSPYATIVTILLFALSTAQVYYSAKVKQYALDVLWAALILLLAHQVVHGFSGTSGPRHMAGTSAANPGQGGRLGALAAMGAVGVWFSHPLIFTLPGALAYLFIEGPRSAAGTANDRAGSEGYRRNLLLVGAGWTVSFALAYFLTARDAAQGPLMQRFWTEGFMPIPPRTAAEWGWFASAFGDLVRNTYDFTERVSGLRTVADLLGAILLLLGVVHLARNQRRLLVLLGTPILVTLLASALSFYPFKGRLILFLVPPTVLLIGVGVAGTLAPSEKPGGRGPMTALSSATRRVGVLAGAALCILSAIVLGDWLRAPFREETRPVLEYVTARGESDAVIYLHSGAQHAFGYYTRYCERCRPNAAEIRRGGFHVPGGESELREEIGALSGNSRVWVVFGHEWWTWGEQEKRMILDQLTRTGLELDRVVTQGASAYLFDLE